MATIPADKTFADIEALLASALAQVEEIFTDLDTEWNERSERWQESDHGQDDRAYVEAWEALHDKLSECQDDLNTLRTGPAK